MGQTGEHAKARRGISWDRYKYGDGKDGKRARIDPRNIKGTGISFDVEKDRISKVPEGQEKEYEAYLDKIAELYNPGQLDKNHRPLYKEDGRTYLGKDPSRPVSWLVPPDWRDDKEFGRGDYDYVLAFLANAQPGINPEDGSWHMPDVGGKMPTHPGFSKESPYAKDPRWAPLAGDWTESGEYIPGEAELKANPDVAAELRQDAKGGDAPGPETAVSETPVSEDIPPEPGEGASVSSPVEGGPRIVINPTTFRNQKDALCVAFNEAFRVVMEDMQFDPVSEPTERQRRFFSDTAYANDETQLRRTILARICTFDTSVKDPTDEQLEEAVEFLEDVMEAGIPQNEWEQSSVQRIHDVIVQSVGRQPAEAPAEEAPAEEAPAEEAQADLMGGDAEDVDRNGDGTEAPVTGGQAENGEIQMLGIDFAASNDVFQFDPYSKRKEDEEQAARDKAADIIGPMALKRDDDAMKKKAPGTPGAWDGSMKQIGPQTKGAWDGRFVQTGDAYRRR